MHLRMAFNGGIKAGIFFSGAGPILILTSYEALDDPKLIAKLGSKGIRKFIAYEPELKLVKKRYGKQFEVILNDVKQDDDLRVLDYNGCNVFHNFSFEEMGPPIVHEAYG